MIPIRIFTNPDYKDDSKVILRDVNREDLFKKLIMFGHECQYAEGDDDKITAYFYDEEVVKMESLYLSNKALMVPLQRVIYANELWRDLMTLWKSYLRRTNSTSSFDK